MKILRLGLLALLLTIAASSAQAFFFSFSSDFGDDWHFGDGWYYDYYGYNAYHPYYVGNPYYRPLYRHYAASHPYAYRPAIQLEEAETKVDSK